MADSKESFEILEDGSGNGVSPTSSQIGEASGGKIGMTVFAYRDASGVLRMPEVNASNVLKTDGSSVTQPVSGTVTANAGTNLNTSALALDATLTNRTQKTLITNGTIDADVSASGQLSLSSNASVVRPLPYEPQTYSAAASAFVPAATATDVWNFQGSGTKTIRIHKIKVTGTTTSGSAIKITISLIRRSAANTGGTSVVGTAVPHDSNNAAATAVVRHYTANPSALGTAVGTVRSDTTSFQGSGITAGVLEWDFEDGGQPLILRGTSQFLSIGFGSVTVTGGVVSISCEWSEV